jgi:nicotinamidase-related amidase
MQSNPANLVTPTPLGSGPHFKWMVGPDHVDMAAAPPPVRPLFLDCAPQKLTLDLNRSAIVVIDMQNDFCAPGGWVDHHGFDYRPDRAPIEPLNRLLPVLRQHGVPVIWVNWGVRADLANMPPNQLHLYKPKGVGIGLAETLPNGAAVLQEGSWAAAIVDELDVQPEDIQVLKHRISGFWDTPLDSILRNLGATTIFFAGVNTDQCVLCSLTDANFLGYGCVLVEDACATSSPGFCTEAAIWNVKKCFGFVTESGQIIQRLSMRAQGEHA